MPTPRGHAPSSFEMAIAQTIKAEQAARGWTIDDLSAAAGIPRTTLIRLRDASRSVRAEQLKQLADAFRMTPSRFVELAEQRWVNRRTSDSATSTGSDDDDAALDELDRG